VWHCHMYVLVQVFRGKCGGTLLGMSVVQSFAGVAVALLLYFNLFAKVCKGIWGNFKFTRSK
jgi:hypothetical protein